MSFSTEGGIDAWSLDRMSDQDVALLGRVAVKDAASLRTRRLVEQRDPRWIEATLDQLPAVTLATLGALCELGGVASMEQIASRLHLLGITVADLEIAIPPAASELLAVPLHTNRGPALALVAPAAPLVAAQLIDIAVPELPTGPFRDDDGDGRVVVALAAAIAQVDVKRTIDGRLHKTALKRLVKQVGLDEATVEESIMAALAAGLIRERDDQQLRVDRAALESAAQGSYPDAPLLRALAEHLRDGGPITHDALARWTERCPPGAGAYLLASRITRLPGFRAGTVATTRALRLALPVGSASGYVTPSFEVFLPPETRPLDVARVAAMCELVRIDRVIVARITKASIARSGLGSAAVLSALREACKSPVPQNVELAIADWAHAVTRAAMADGRVIAVEPAAAERTRTALAPFAPRELAPGVFVISREVTARAIVAALARIDVRCDDEMPDAPAPEARSIPPLAARASRHRTRVSAWKNREPFEGKVDDFLERGRRVAKPGPSAHGATTPDPSAKAGATPLARRLTTWERRYGARLPPGERELLLSALGRLAPPVVETILDACDVSGLFDRLRMLTGEVLGEDDDLGGLDWHRDDLRGRLERAAGARRAMAIDYNGIREIVDLHRVEKRGTAWLVLGAGEDFETIAIPLTAIEAVAELIARPERQRWAPAAGQPVPPGHVPCPCGSGERYRNCCRASS